MARHTTLSTHGSTVGAMDGSGAYWIGEQPLDGERWSYAEFGTVLNDVATRQTLFGMYGRYVRRWNDIELDPKRSLFEHTHQVHGARVLAADGRFVLHGRPDRHSHWVLEILFRRGFREFYPWTLERNAMRLPVDMRSVHLHWCGNGREAFARWMEKEQAPRKDPASRSTSSRIGRRLQGLQHGTHDVDKVRRHPWLVSWAVRWLSRG